MKKHNNIEDLFKDKFENFEADVKPDVWKNIRTALKGFGLGFLIKSLINKMGTNTIVAVVSSAATIISTVWVMNWTGGDDKKPETAETKQVTSQAIVEPQAVVENNASGNVPSVEEVTKPAVTAPIVEKETVVEKEKKESATPISKTDKEEMESVIHKYTEKPVADIFASPTSVTVATPVSFMNNGTGKVNKWVFGDSKKVETETSPVHYYSQPGIYTVKLISTNAEGKTSVDSVKIEVLGNSNPSFSSIPSDFSPNGDKNLDEFVFKIGENIIHLDAIIFDNKGVAVYEKQGDQDIIWDGKDKKGKDVKVGTYFYIINAIGVDGKKYERQGAINLTR